MRRIHTARPAACCRTPRRRSRSRRVVLSYAKTSWRRPRRPSTTTQKRATMGKRSNFERVPRDFYPTPFAAVPPLIPFLRGVRTFAEACCGNDALVDHLKSFGLRCVYKGDIKAGQHALALDTYGDADAIITNPP